MATGKPRVRRPPPPTEDQEQMALATWLKTRGLLFTHAPNGGVRSWATAKRLAACGVSAGVPDVLIFTPPPHRVDTDPYVGAAIELKRQRGGTVSPQQKAWLAGLAHHGWAVQVCRGAREAVMWLLSLGY